MLHVKLLLPMCFTLFPTKSEVIECATVLAALYNVKPAYVLSVIEVESNYDAAAFNESDPHGGAIGLMQLLYPTAELMGYRGTREDLFIPYNNIIYGIRYLKKKLIRYDGHVGDAVAAYNAGKAYVKKGDYVNQKHVDKFRQAYAQWRSKR